MQSHIVEHIPSFLCHPNMNHLNQLWFEFFFMKENIQDKMKANRPSKGYDPKCTHYVSDSSLVSGTKEEKGLFFFFFSRSLACYFGFVSA